MSVRRLSPEERAIINKRVQERADRAEGAQENTVSTFNLYKDQSGKNYGIIESTSPAELRKAVAAMRSGMKVFMPTPDGNVEMDLDSTEAYLLSVAGKASDGTRDPQNPASSFPGSASIAGRPVPAGADSVRPQPVYQYDEPTAWTRVGPSFVASNADPNIAAPANFSAPTPGKQPQGETSDLTDAGNFPVFKSADQRHAVAKGTFANTATNLDVAQDHERNEKR